MAEDTGDQKDVGKFRALASAIVSRLQLSNYLGMQYGGKRDLYDVFGYPRVLKVEQLLAKYSRQDIASRIVSMPASAIWNSPPKMVGDSALVEAWNTLVRKHRIWNALLRADKLSAMGRYSAVMIGVTDSSASDVPLTRGDNRELIYLKPLAETSCEIQSFETDTADPRYGLPKMYKVSSSETRVGDPNTKTLKDMKVHSSRVVHIVQDPLEDLVYGIPIMERVYNLLEDLLKVSGGSAETYWLNSRRGLQADIDKEMVLDEDDAKDLSDMLDEYQHNIRRIIRTRGVNLKDLGADVPDPRGTFDVITALISGTTGIPQRILVGSEAGQLASEQDRANWADRVEERRMEFAEPIVLEPLIDRFQQYGILPEGEYSFEWPDAFKLSPLERAQTMAQKARAISNLTRQYDGKHTPMSSVDECRAIVGLNTEFDPTSVPLPSEDTPLNDMTDEDVAEIVRNELEDKG